MKNKEKKNILKSFLFIAFYLLLMIVMWLILKYFKLDDINTLRELCSNGFAGQLIFILLQILQVIFLPINSIIFTVPAILIFGPLEAFLISYVGIVIGSIIMFFIGRCGGLKILNLLVGKDKAMHYAKTIGKGKFLLPIFMLIAVFPDDILCVSAGLSNIKFSYFLCVILVTRAIDLIFTCFVGTIAIKSSLGIILLAIFLIVAIIFAIILTKKQEKIEKWFVQALSKNKNMTKPKK